MQNKKQEKKIQILSQLNPVTRNTVSFFSQEWDTYSHRVVVNSIADIYKYSIVILIPFPYNGYAIQLKLALIFFC